MRRSLLETPKLVARDFSLAVVATTNKRPRRTRQWSGRLRPVWLRVARTTYQLVATCQSWAVHYARRGRRSLARRRAHDERKTVKEECPLLLSPEISPRRRRRHASTCNKLRSEHGWNGYVSDTDTVEILLTRVFKDHRFISQRWGHSSICIVEKGISH